MTKRKIDALIRDATIESFTVASIKKKTHLPTDVIVENLVQSGQWKSAKNKTNIPWQQEETQEMKGWIETGMTLPDIAKHLKRPLKDLKEAVERENLSLPGSITQERAKKPWTIREAEKVKRMVMDQKSFLEIANELKRPESSVRYRCTKLDNATMSKIKSEIMSELLRHINDRSVDQIGRSIVSIVLENMRIGCYPMLPDFTKHVIEKVKKIIQSSDFRRDLDLRLSLRSFIDVVEPTSANPTAETAPVRQASDREPVAVEDNVQSIPTCSICLENYVNTAFQCGHSVCSGCLPQLQNCHVCRRSIETTVPLYLN